ncbi:MAG: response regulator [Burkholderiaceae bacterium]
MDGSLGNPVSSALALPDSRPLFRVALFGVENQLQHVLEVVSRHARHNPYRFCLARNRTASEFDIAMVDMSAAGGPEVAGTLNRLLNGRPIVKLGRRSDAARECDDVTHNSFARQVIQSLNRFVEHHLNARAGASSAAALTAMTTPAASAGRTPSPTASAAVTQSPITRPRRPRALIVDDSPTVRRQLSVALHQMGMDCDTVNSAVEALDLLDQRAYELIFADVMMPGQDGYQLTREIKRNRLLKGVPVIILTSRSSPFDLAKGALAGCSSYLVKPVSLQSLRDTVSRQLRRAVAARKEDSSRLLSLA